jgi:hypothetical protein
MDGTFRVEYIRPMEKNLYIHCANENSKMDILGYLSEKGYLHVGGVKERDSYCSIGPVYNEHRSEDLIDSLLKFDKKFKDINANDIQFFKRVKINGAFCNFVYKVSNSLKSKLEKDPIVFYDQRKLCVREFVPLKQCTYCGQYGHTVSNCNAKRGKIRPKCPKCGGNHTLASNKCSQYLASNEVSCSACGNKAKSPHNSWWRYCPTRIEYLMKVRTDCNLPNTRSKCNDD